MKRFTRVIMLLLSSFLVCCDMGDGDIPRSDNAYKITINLNGSLQNPAWSPDGKSLLVTRFQNGYNTGPADLYIINLETTAVTLLFADGSENVNLPGSVWNDANNTIVFSSDSGAHDEIFKIAANGGPGDEVQLTQRAADQAFEPSFSPGMDFIVFESHVVDVEGDGKIVKKDLSQATHSGFTDLTDPAPLADGDCRQPNWSPAGNLILYQRFSGGKWDIWVMNTDGSNNTQVTTAAGDNTDASFSPDANKIVYSADNGELEHANLFIIPVGGGAPERLTFNNGGYDGAPSWSPDGTKVAFESCGGDPDGSSGTTIWIIAIK